jgi:isopentenyl-diphosphate delta-isomerase type 1
MEQDEWFDLVDETGRVIGRATRRECHGNPALMHPVVHVLVFDRRGRLYLQRRSAAKDIQPGKWDTSVGGHFQPGEAPEAAAKREMREELGVEPASLAFAYQYVWRSNVETELIRAFATVHDGPFELNREELDDGRFWTMDEIRAALADDRLTPQLRLEFPRMLAWRQTRTWPG